MVRDAFHWDMLSAAQMEASAAAGELPNPRTYGKTFGGLNDTQRTNVRALFARMIIARGIGPLILQNDGIDADDPNGEVGTTDITVNVSDGEGRLVDSSAGVIGQTFEVASSRTPLGVDPLIAFLIADYTTANGITYTAAECQDRR